MRSRALVLLGALLCGLALPAWSAPPTVTVLFVGNSLTSVNDLPGTFVQYAAGSTLHARVTARSSLRMGAFLAEHWKAGEALRALREFHPDFLVLQAQSTEPLTDPAGFETSAGRFKAEADQLRATTVILSTWARPAGDPFYSEPVSGGRPAEMQARLNAAYSSLARRLGALLAPAGLAWQVAARVSPDVPLLDGTQHPSLAGTYLAAAVLFRTLFPASSVRSEFFDTLPPRTAMLLQKAAAATPR